MSAPLVILRTVCCLLLVGMAAVPAFAQSTFSAATTIRDAGNPRRILPGWTLSVGGLWPTQCPPVLQTVALDGNELRVDARSVLDLCAREPIPFSIEVNPALALQRGALAAGVYRVSFYAAEGALAQPKLRAFALIDRTESGAAAILPETGFWSSADSDRTLLSLELQGGQLSAALLSYDPDGQPAWLFGSASYDGRIAHMPLLRLAGGGDVFSAATVAPHGDAAMTLDLQFSASAHAQAWLSRMRADDGSLQLRTLELSRLPLAESADGSAWQGEWVLVGDAADAAPQRLRLNRFQALDARHFQIASADGAVVLACERGTGTQDSPPQTCNLRLADGSSNRFDAVAIARMDGFDASGAAVHLLRVKP